eukprot:COSAG06_NODE_47194_length_341_cov_0.599174_1_plen_74_part_01
MRGWVAARAEALLETHRGQATPEAGAAALAYGRLMGGDGLGHQAAPPRVLIFFKQKTAYEMESRDWSSDVCSSD